MKKDTVLLALIAVVVAGAGVAFWLWAGGDEDDEGLDASGSDYEYSEAGVPAAAPSRVAAPTRPRSKADDDAGPRAPVDHLPPPAEYAAHVSGVVLDDRARPLPGAAVALCRNIADHANLVLQGEILLHTKTDAEGHFEIRDVGEGSHYLLRVEHEDFASKFVPRVDLAAGESKTLEIRLARGLAVTGVVEDASGGAVAGVRVYVEDKTMRIEDARQSVERETTTDEQGRFAIAHLTFGFKRVVATKTGYATAIRDGLHLNQNRAGEPIKLVLEPGASLSGIVVDDQSMPVEGATVLAQPYGQTVQRVRTHFPTVTTDAGGRFVYEGLVEGSYTLTAQCRGYDPRGARANAKTGDVTTRLQLTRSPVIRGRVVDVRGDPLPRFSIVASARETLVMSSERYTEHFANEQGEFDYTCSMRTGRVYLFAKAPGFAGGRSDLVTLDRKKLVEGVTIVVSRGTTVSGRVVDSSGQGIARASVKLQAYDERMNQMGGLGALLFSGVRSTSFTGVTDGQGRYEIKSVSPGRFSVKATHVDYAAGELDHPVEVSEADELAIPAVSLVKGGTVSGTVFGEDSSPLPNAVVKLTARTLGVAGASYQAGTDARGNFAIRHVRPGSYFVDLINSADPRNILRPLLQGRQAQRTEVTVSEGQESQVELR